METQTKPAPESPSAIALRVPASEAALAASANSRINIPLNLENWQTLDQEVQEALLWFHQHVLDEGLSWEECEQALGYDNSTIFRVLKGNYSGSWPNIVKAIFSYKKIIEQRGKIQRGEFVETPVTRMIWAALDYAVANNSITIIAGASGHGKTISAEQWRDRHNHGRSVMIEAPPVGGTRDFLRVICESLGVNKNMAVSQMREAILRGFNKNRMLIVDEAHRLLPNDYRRSPEKIDFLRYIHDRTGCAVALLATNRLDEEMNKSTYMFEQVLGRVGLPVRLPKVTAEPHFLPLLRQYIPRPTKEFVKLCHDLVNDKLPAQKGRLRLLHQVLRVASRIANDSKQPLDESHFYTALATREKMMGEKR